MTAQDRNMLGKALWEIADDLRGIMNADSFRDYMLSLIFLRYLSDNYEKTAKEELGSDYPSYVQETKEYYLRESDDEEDNDGYDDKDHISGNSPLSKWYLENSSDIDDFEKMMRRSIHYVIKPRYLWSNIVYLAKTQDSFLLKTLQAGFKYIENDSFKSTFKGLFSEINLNSEKLGKTPSERNKRLCTIISKIAEKVFGFSSKDDTLGDAYEFLIGKFAAGSGQKAGEFYTPQEISTILSSIVILDSQKPEEGEKPNLDNVFDFACGSGSLLLNVRNRLHEKGKKIGKIYGQELNSTTYNLARMNMLLHGVKDSEFEIFQGDSLTNDWDMLNEMNPAKKKTFDAIVANPPFSLKWSPTDSLEQDFRFSNYGLAPKSAADFAFLLHGFHFLSKEGTMAIVLPHGVLFRGGAEKKIRTKLLTDNSIDAVIGLPSNLFYSTGIPVCILVLKKCKMNDDVLFINASEYYAKEKRQNRLRTGEDGEPNDIAKIIETYQFRKEDDKHYSRRVEISEIIENDYNLNIPRYVNTFKEEEPIDIKAVMSNIKDLEGKRAELDAQIAVYLKELGLDF